MAGLPSNDYDYISDVPEELDIEMLDGDSVTENDSTYEDPFEYNGPSDIGVPEEIEPIQIEPDEDLVFYKVRHYSRNLLTNYEPAYLQELAEAGCKFYAIYDDETEVEIQWTDIEDLDPLETEIDLSEAIASASNQHFWDDTNGVHVAEVAKEDWQAALEANFADLSSSKNYYNILMNSLGLLLRRANFNLTSINRAAISFYDGLGNDTVNIMASFGRNSAQIGRSTDKHVVINDSGLTAYNSDGSLAPLTGTFDGANINNSSITNAKIVDGTIEGTKIASATIDNSNIKNGTIEGTKIASATIDNSNIKNGTIEGSKIKGGTITGSLIADGTIEDTDIKNGTITGTKIASATIDNSNIKNGTIEGTKIASATIENSNIKDGTITGAKIQGATLTDIPYAGITDADIEVARVANAEIDKAKVDYAHVTNGVIDNAKIDKANVNGLAATYATITNLNAATARIGTIESDYLKAADMTAEQARVNNLLTDKADITDLSAATARIDELEADHVSVEDFEAEQANIDNLQAATADIETIRANSAKVSNLTAAELEADHATVGNLSATYATIDSLDAAEGRIGTLETDNTNVKGRLTAAEGNITTLNASKANVADLTAATGRISDLESTRVRTSDLEANYITADAIEAAYTKTDFSNTDVAWIQNGVIKDGSISSAMINSVSANKLTAGTINGSVINVTNLNADNITAGTINGQRIGEGSLSLDKLSEDVYTEAEVDAKLSTMQSQIDGAIETWTGTAVPTLQNSPASSWNTTALKDSHVGDVYFVVNSQSQQNGYNYRFTKSGSTYSWQLIKDSDVTNALQRISTAEGKITTFDSDISQLKTDTGTLTTKTTSLETRMSDAEADILDKVDTTTFNEVSDTVDSHSQSISQMSTTLSNKADSSTVTAVTNRVSKNEQDISGINTTIGTLQTTVESKADGSTVETMSTKLNTVSDTVDGHTQSISSINSTLETKADSSTVSTLTTKVNNVSDTVDGHTSQLSSITQTQTTIQQNAVKSTVQLWFTKANTTAPAKPTAHVTTNNAATGNTWNLAVPLYNSAYPNYYYCYEYQYVDGSYGWSAVTRDIATGEMQATARQAQSDIDNLEIGGRNLLLWSGDANYSPVTRWGSQNNVTSKSYDTTYDAFKYITPVDSGNQNNGMSIFSNHSAWLNEYGLSQIANEKTYTFSIDVMGTLSSGNPMTMKVFYSTPTGDWNATPNPAVDITDKVKSDSFTRMSLTFTLPSTRTEGTRIALSLGAKGATFYVKNPKLELGNRATDWSPAPEDVDADISTAQTSADNAQATANKNVKESQQLWFTKANGSAPNKPTAKVTSTSTGGNAWTTKVPTYNASYPHYFYCMQYIAADGTVTWSDVVYDQATTEAQSVARTTSANLTTLQQDYATFKQTTQQFESTIGTTYATKTELQTTDDKIENLEIGGRNLLRHTTHPEPKGLHSQAIYDTDGWYVWSNPSVAERTDDGIKATFNTNANGFVIPFVNDDIILGETDYILSFDARGTFAGPTMVYALARSGSNWQTNEASLLSLSETEWAHVEIPVRWPSFSGRKARAILYPYNNTSGKWIEIRDGSTKFEKGNRATDWTPAPEDVDAAIDKVDSKTSVRLHLRRDNWSDTSWGAYASVGHADNFQNIHIASGGATSATGFDATTLNVGDLIVIEGISTGTSIPYSATAKVTAVPTSATGTIPATVVSANNAKAIESRVSTAETSITQNTEQIALRAKSSDVYTKTQVDGKITQEVSDRNSAIEQSASAINLSVSKISSVKYYRGASSTLANIKTWAAEGYTGIWTFTGDLSNLRIGDTVYLKYGDTTRGCHVYVKGTVNSISGQLVNMTSHGYEDVLPVDTIKSTINQSSDSVKIEARHVNIEGAAIFSSGRLSETSLNNAYDAKGAAASLVSGGDNLIGGFNNSYVGNGEYNYRTGRFQSKTTLNTADNTVILQYYSGTTPTSAGTYVGQHSDAFRVANVGETCSFKFEKPSGFTHLHLKFNGSQQDARVAWDVTPIPVGTELILTFKLDSISSDGQGNGGVMSGINLRTGNMPSRWSLAPEDVEIGGRNLLRNTNWTPETITAFKTSTYSTTQLGNAIGEWYRETQVTLGFDASGLMTITVPNITTRYGIYQDVSLSPGHYILSVDTGSFFKLFIDSAQWPAKNPIDGSNSRNSVEIDVAEEAIYRVYIAYNNGAVMYGNYIKLERGTKATDWSPAPEDVNADISAAESSAKGYADTKKSEAISAAATDATNKANAAEASAKGYADEQASETYEKIRSQGIQLVTNGNGFMGDNTNFSWWTFDGSKSNGSPGSFTHAPSNETVFTDEMFPVDTAKDYMVEFDAFSTGSGAHPQLYAMLAFYDVDKKLMNIQQVSYIIGSTTTLARELKNGDTVIYLTNASGFIDTSVAHQRSLIFWDYTNSFGYTYPPETYSRNFYAPSAGLWSDYSKINKSNNTITLTTAWAGGTKPAGTYLSQNSSGPTYAYFWYRTGTSFHLDEWTHASGIYSGFQTGIANAAGKFYKGCSYCKIGWLWNYQNSSSNPQKQIWITNISVKEATATKSELDSVATTANNAAPKSSAIARTQRIYWRATSNTKPSANTTWLSTSGDGYGNWSLNVPQLTKGSTKYPYLYTAVQSQTVAQQAAGSTCTCSTVMIDDSTTVIDGGHIITGSVDANRLAANSVTADKLAAGAITAQKLNIGDTANYSALDVGTAAYYGFTYDDTADGRWFTMTNLKRDTVISPAYDCQGGEKFKISFEVSSSVQGRVNSSATEDTYLTVAVGAICLRETGGGYAWPSTSYTTSSASAPVTAVESIITLNAEARRFQIFIQLNGVNSPAMTGTFKIRNLKVYKMTGGELIVDGSVKASAISATSGTFNTANIPDLNASKITAGDIAAARIKANVITAINSLTAGTINADRIDASSLRIGYSQLNNPPTIPSKVSQLTNDSNYQTSQQVTNSINGIDIGGRNLLLGAATQDTSVGNNRESVTETEDTWLGCKVFRSSVAWADIGFRFDIQVVERGLAKAGDVLTYSIWAKTDDTTSRDIYGVWMSAKSGSTHMSGTKIATLTSEWTRYEKQITVTQAMLDTATVGMATRFECNTGCTSGKYIYWAAPKLEKGTKATDWTPAPEDVDVDISAAAQTATNYITHVDNNGITIHPSSNTNNRVGINANGMTVYKGGYLKANFADTITLYGGSNASGANPKMEVTSTQIKMTSSDGTQRLSADSSTGVVVGNPSKGRVVVNDNGLTIYDVNNRKRSAINSDGLEVFAGTDSASVAKFGSATRIGKTGESHILQDYHSMQMVDKENKTYFHVSDLRGSNGLVSVTDTFVAESNGANLQLSYWASSLTSVTSNGTDVTSGCNVTETTVYAGEVSYLTSVLHGSWAAGATVVCTYTTSSELAKGLTFGIRGSAAIGGYSSSFGYGNNVSGFTAFASGQANDATGISSHAEGYSTTASGRYAHAEGGETTARDACSHAEGSHTIASGWMSHAEGSYSKASAQASHAEGADTNATEVAAHAEGIETTASGIYSHAQNSHTIAAYDSQTAIGKYNANQSTNAFEVGNGTDSARSNALIVDWDGNLIAQGMAGMVQMFAGSTAPTGWLICNGAAVSRTTYATLFAVIGTTWGSGDGSTTFNLPDLRGRVPIGAGTGSGLTARSLAAKGGSENIQAHTHAFTQPTVKTELKFQKNAASGSALNRVAGSNLSNPAETSTYTATVTGGAVGAVSGASTGTAGNMPPFAVINFIICTGKTS